MLTTRCPHCGTAFRVKPEQLRARGGRVRCGHCQAPFSALEGLIEAPRDVVAESPTQPPAEAPVAPPQETPPPVAVPAQAAEVAPEPVAIAAPPVVPEAPAPEPQPEPVSAAPDAPPPAPAPVVQPEWPVPEPSASPAKRPVFRRALPDASVAPLVPPLPELEPTPPRRSPHVELDFDLDATDLADISRLPAEEAAPAVSTADTEATQLTVAWQEPAFVEPEHAQAAHEAQVTLAESDWRGGHPVTFGFDTPPTEIALEPEKEIGAPEPVFVTSFSSPQGSSSTPIWPVEPVMADSDAADVEPVVDTSESDAAIQKALEEGRERRRAELARTKASGKPESAKPPPRVHDEHDPDESEETHPYWADEIEPRRRAWPWVAGVVVLGVAGLAQGLLWARHDVARELPETRPLFEAACEELGCAMPWPRVPTYISVEATDMHPPTTKDGAFEMSGTLRNRAGFAQAYPYLEITLTDVYNRALVRRALKPEEWLPASLRGTQAFAPNTDIAFTVTFDAREQPASGYNLYAFYP